MNIIKHKLTRSQRNGFKCNGSGRDGLSVIEVLTSIVVALIGVFGVLAMIPFSVKQTQSGLDQDAATSMARNALADFEASRFKETFEDSSGTRQLNWIDSANTNVVTAISNATSLVCIDPLGVTEQNNTFNPFPFNSPSPITIPTVTLAQPGVPLSPALPFTLAEARRMFRLTDGLVFAQDDDPTVTDSDLLGPVQIFNEGAAGLLNRQSNGTISWCAIAEPTIASANASEIRSYKFHILVFKDRVTDSMVPESEMLSSPVLSPTTFGQSASVTIPATLTDDVRRNDWVMLINQETTGSGSIAQQTNISFARITNLFNNDNGLSRISIDGSDFPFTSSGLAADGTGTTTPDATHIVHLRDVVAVFSRTIKLETNSEWTVTTN